jgi:crotonobetainyl-CoA:carnitine CoA-transferase CaiB-like acyl-CoA transferase
VHLAAFNDKFYRNLCRALDAPQLLEDPRFASPALRLEHRDALDAEIAACCARYPRAELMARLEHADVVAAPVNDYPAATADPQLRHNGMFVPVEHTAHGRLEVPGIPLHLAGTPGAVRRPPPMLGEHTSEILGELACRVDVPDAP